MRQLLALAVAAVIAPIALTAQTQPRDTTVTVSITRTGRAPADRMTFYLGIEALAESTPAAIDRLQAKIKSVQDTIKRVSPSSTTDAAVMVGVAAGGQGNYPPAQGSVWVARAVLRVNVNKIADLTALQSAANVAGASVNGGAAYESSQLDAVWKAKVAEAIEAARGAAQASATAQGYKLGSLLTMSLNGGPQNLQFQPPQLNFDSRNYSYTPLTAPEVVVNSVVNVTYLLVRNK
ncbi:MAG: SIMPL domain-containing protein [Gemmatimonadaceae bacterium]